MIFKSSNQGVQFGRVPGGGLGCLLGFALILFAGYYAVKGLYYVLWWAAPALVVLTLIINWRVIPNTLTNWLKSLEKNPLSGLISAALVVIGFPFFALWLFLKALGTRKLDNMKQGGSQNPESAKDEFVDFEEIESTPLGKAPEKAPEPEILEVREDEKPGKQQNPYDGFFS